jgi:regulator of sigma E protease
MLSFLQTFGSFVLVLGILVFIHEFGHFLMAKFLGIGVRVFSIGFGPRIAGFRRGGTDYRVAALPLGGYVRLAGDESDEHRSGAPDEFLTRSRWQRFLVYVAGPVFNIMLALVLTWAVLWAYGEAAPGDRPVVVAVYPGTGAEAAGILPGDRILEIEGRDTIDLQVVFEEILMSPESTRTVLIQRDGRERTIQLDTGADDRYHMGFPGWELRTSGSGEPIRIGTVIPGTPADLAGLAAGDMIVGAEDQEPIGEVALRALLSLSPGRPVTLHVEREGNRFPLTLTPREEDGKGKIGVTLYTLIPKQPLGAGAAVTAAVRVNIERSSTLFFVLKKLFSGQLSIRAFSGPLEIAQFSRFAVRSGLETFLTFLAFISLQLGILNLLPVPILDGGHILILTVESIMGRDLSEQVKERAMQAGMVLLLAFFGAVLTFDVIKTRLFDVLKSLF